MGLRWRRSVLALLVVVVAVSTLLARSVAEWTGGDAVEDGSQPASDELIVPAFRLDDVPGFGRSDSAVARDDTIALYESWQAERRIAQCMRAGGLPYRPRAQYAENADVRSALLLGVEVAPGRRDGPGIARPQTTRPDPAARRQRERRCIRRAGREGPQVWRLKDELFDDLLEAQTTQAVGSATFRSARGPFDECVARHLGQTVAHISDLEVALLSADDADSAEECFALWERAAAPAVEQSLSVFVARHQDRLAAQIRAYEGAIEDIASDRTFIRWLRRELRP